MNTSPSADCRASVHLSPLSDRGSIASLLTGLGGNHNLNPLEALALCAILAFCSFSCPAFKTSCFIEAPKFEFEIHNLFQVMPQCNVAMFLFGHLCSAGSLNASSCCLITIDTGFKFKAKEHSGKGRLSVLTSCQALKQLWKLLQRRVRLPGTRSSQLSSFPNPPRLPRDSSALECVIE